MCTRAVTLLAITETVFQGQSLSRSGRAGDGLKECRHFGFSQDAVEEGVTEEGWAPPESIDRVIAGVLSRTGEDAGEPLEERMDAGEAGWCELLNRLDPSG